MLCHITAFKFKFRVGPERLLLQEYYSKSLTKRELNYVHRNLIRNADKTTIS